MTKLTSFNDFIKENPEMSPYVIKQGVYGAVSYTNVMSLAGRGFDLASIPEQERPTLLRGLWYVMFDNRYKHYNAITGEVIKRYIRRFQLPIETDQQRRIVAAHISNLMEDVKDNNLNCPPKREVYWRSKGGGEALTGSVTDIRIFLSKLAV